MITQTSLEAYRGILPKINEKQMKVLRIIKSCKVGLTNHEISKCLGWEINRVTPRVKELREMGLVEFCGLRKQETGRNGMVWIFRDVVV